jgi:acyl-CoA dehydrogenase
MNDVIEALSAAVGDACVRLSDADEVTSCADGGWNPRLWAALEQIGVTTISVHEDRGGAGGDVRTAVAVLEVLGQHSAGVPVAETALLAGWLLAECGASVPTGPMTAVVAGPEVSLRRTAVGWSITGTLPRVGWARHAEAITVLAGDRAVLLDRGDFTVEPGTNLAGEPRDTVVLGGAIVPAGRVYDCQAGAITVPAFRHRAALARTALMAGAARRALELSLAYAREREQFGRPLTKFQAVQQTLATLAGEVLLGKVAAESAALVVDSGADADVAVSAAKAAAGHAAGLVCTMAHQIHGAIGFTEEHALRHSTTRLWAWRDECGNDDEWATRLGTRALGAGADGLWPLLTGTQ